MKINIIVAIDLKGGIAKDGKLPWRVPEEMKFFREKTINQVVLMGRKTADTLKHGRLIDRINIIVTRDPSKEYKEYTFYYDSIETALQAASMYNRTWDRDDEIWVIGGLEIYKQLLPISDKIYMSVIQDDYNCDTFFPSINMNVWDLKSRYTPHETFKVYEYERKNIGSS